ncbi:unnamed protein product [Meganyctiphanes norvegica]|uniref:G-protein coupled receptors family 1 profile domain-containing protein n=1 Tax=Meganyctiphanes norvegica TaxID=48144 RepID=A0AAV2PLS5_MEGNR
MSQTTLLATTYKVLSDTVKERTIEHLSITTSNTVISELLNATTSYNETLRTEEMLKEISKPVLGIVAASTFTIGLVGTVGNLVAVISLLSSNRLRVRPSTYFVVSLPLSLLPVCLIGMPYYGIIALQVLWYNRVLMPRITSMAIAVSCFVFSEVHIHTICALALNRTLAVCQPNFYRRVMSSRRYVFSYLTLLWIYSTLVWLPITFLKLGQRNPRILEMARNWVFARKSLLVRNLLTGLVITYDFIGHSYSAIIRTVRNSNVTENSNVKRQWDHHVTKTITVIFLVLVVCSVPHLVIHSLHIYLEQIHTWLLLHVLFWVQFCIDPFIYVACSSEYRAACLQFLARLLPNLECLKNKVRDVEYEATKNREPTVTLPIRTRKTSVVFANNSSLLSKGINRQTSQDSNKILARQASQEVGKRLQRQRHRSQGSNSSLAQQTIQESNKRLKQKIKQERNNSLTRQTSRESNKSKRFKQQISQESNNSLTRQTSQESNKSKKFKQQISQESNNSLTRENKPVK